MHTTNYKWSSLVVVILPLMAIILWQKELFLVLFYAPTYTWIVNGVTITSSSPFQRICAQTERTSSRFFCNSQPEIPNQVYCVKKRTVLHLSRTSAIQREPGCIAMLVVCMMMREMPKADNAYALMWCDAYSAQNYNTKTQHNSRLL